MIRPSFLSEVTASVEAVSTYFTFRQTDAFNQSFKRIELQGCQAKAIADCFDQTVIAFRAGFGVLVEVGVRVAFKFFNQATGEQFHV